MSEPTVGASQGPFEGALAARTEGRIAGRLLGGAVRHFGDHHVEIPALPLDDRLQLLRVGRQLRFELGNERAVLRIELAAAVGVRAGQHADREFLLRHAQAPGGERCVVEADLLD